MCSKSVVLSLRKSWCSQPKDLCACYKNNQWIQIVGGVRAYAGGRSRQGEVIGERKETYVILSK